MTDASAATGALASGVGRGQPAEGTCHGLRSGVLLPLPYALVVAVLGCPVSGATGYLYIPADATMIELKDLRLEPTGG
ncbi:hypothetical protein RW1_009_01250 [Rhodococcus wratislaviensis NBRC 100605]|uniref:Uncharacterized protein n=1 Tax=Rhodococcus wratislaviensis NBRC 100605 TaxID=1219028 RepID=X0Q0L9_RHOWR|nr:hypothetical protein RW1_009_01250 [Rhodococcus wratislaviensis NBRC 100605]